MKRSNVELLCENVDAAMAKLNAETLEKDNGNDWKYEWQGITSQIVVADVLQNDMPHLVMYFMVTEIMNEHKPIVLEELMKANMQLTTKYALLENRAILVVELQQVSHMSADSIHLSINMYTQHVLKVKQDLQQLVIDKTARNN